MSLSVFVSLQITNHGSVYVLTGWVFSNNAVTLRSLMHVVLIVFCIFYNFNVSHYSKTSCSSVLQICSGFEQMIFCYTVCDKALL